MTRPYDSTLPRWHAFVRGQGQDTGLLGEILADEVVFHSPVVWTPQAGKPITMRYLLAAVQVLEDFQYRREFFSEDSVALEFNARIGDTIVQGMDIIRFNSDGQIIDFEVMARPARALQALTVVMGEKLKQAGS